LNEVTEEEFKNYVVQEYVTDSKEYAGYFVAYCGNIIYSFALVANFGDDEYIKNQDIHKSKPHDIEYVDPETIKILELFLKPYNFTGTCCFDYKIKDGKHYIFEINPRIGGQLNYLMKEYGDVVRKMIEIYDHRNVDN
jgi:5-formaminoimidazole-4-carboxamide-1-beta-D-ribofuranosyl 5'-monophosphate synthetase